LHNYKKFTPKIGEQLSNEKNPTIFNVNCMGYQNFPSLFLKYETCADEKSISININVIASALLFFVK